MSPLQRNAWRAFWIAAFGASPEGFVINANQVYWEPTNMPIPGWPWCTLDEIGTEDLGVPTPYAYMDGATPRRALRVMQEVSVEVQLGNRRGDSPSHESNAVRVLELARARLYDDEHIYPLRVAGVGVARVGNVVPLPGLVNDSQWETRGSLVVVVHRAEVFVSTSTGIITSAGLSVSVAPVPGTVVVDPIGP